MRLPLLFPIRRMIGKQEKGSIWRGKEGREENEGRGREKKEGGKGGGQEEKFKKIWCCAPRPKGKRRMARRGNRILEEEAIGKRQTYLK